MEDEFLSYDWAKLDNNATYTKDSREFAFKLDPSSLPKYLDLRTILVCLKVSLVKVNTETGKEVAVIKEDNVTVINNLLSSFFKDVKINVNGSRIYTSPQHYATINQLRKKLSDGPQALNTYRDLEGSVEEDNPATTVTTNTAFYRRVLEVATKTKAPAEGAQVGTEPDGDPKILTYIGPLTTPYQSANTLLAYNSSLIIKLTRNSDDFLITTGPKTHAEISETSGWAMPANTRYKLLVHHLSLSIRTPLVTDAVFSNHKSRFAKGDTQRIYFYQVSLKD